MKHISSHKFYVLILCFLMSTLVSTAQSQNQDWSAESYLVAVNGTDVEITSNLSKQNTSFTWEQVRNTDAINSNVFTIESASGNWNAQDNLGQLNYELTTEDLASATLTITGTAEGITMLLVINDTNGNADKSYTFYIETFTNL